jgi:hypothetical protein
MFSNRITEFLCRATHALILVSHLPVRNRRGILTAVMTHSDERECDCSSRAEQTALPNVCCPLRASRDRCRRASGSLTPNIRHAIRCRNSAPRLILIFSMGPKRCAGVTEESPLENYIAPIFLPQPCTA